MKKKTGGAIQKGKAMFEPTEEMKEAYRRETARGEAMKDRAHITVDPKREVIFRGADLVDEIAKLKAERDEAYATSLELEKQSLTAYVRGLKRAKEITVEKLVDCSIEEEHTIKELQDSIQAEIDKAKASKP